MSLTPVEQVEGEKEKIKAIIKNKSVLGAVDLHLPSGEDIRMSGLRKFAAVVPLYTLQADGETLYNNETQENYALTMKSAFTNS